MDYFLKYVEIAAVPSLAASHVIEFLKTNFQWRHRMPKKLISDRSKTFRSRQLRSFLHRAEVGHHFASSYHPQANGLTERTNQSIQTRLAPYVETHKVEEADWDQAPAVRCLLGQHVLPIFHGKNPVRIRLWATSEVGRRGQFGRSRQSRQTCRSAGGVPQYQNRSTEERYRCAEDPGEMLRSPTSTRTAVWCR